MNAFPRIGVGVIITKGDSVLLLRRGAVHGSGTWSTPGGHLDFGETLEQCAAREAMEETGVAIADIAFRAVTNDLFRAEGRHYITVWMEAQYVTGQPAVAAPHEMTEVAWFDWNALPDPLFLPFRNLLAGRCYPPKEGSGRAKA